MKSIYRKPSWLKAKQLGKRRAAEISKIMAEKNLHTVCESAKCPNKGECFENDRAVFLILGNVCTRNCKFCAIKSGKNLPPLDTNEPQRVAEMAKKLELRHIIITSVTRDDLPDGGAGQFKNTIKELRKELGQDILIEVLTPDFYGKKSSINLIINEKPTVFNHNLETIERLYPEMRHQSDYHRSLSVLKFVKQENPDILTKTGIMVGFGETKEEVIELLKDAKKNFVDIITIGQYLKPANENYSVKEYILPEIFEFYKNECEKIGFLYVESGPLIRSSYYKKNLNDILKKRKVKMQFTITARHFELTTPVKDYAEKSFERLEKYSEQILAAGMVLAIEKNRNIVEFNISIKKTNLMCKTKEKDMYLAIDRAVKKMERQLTTHFGKLHRHHPNKNIGIKNIPVKEISPQFEISRKNIVPMILGVESAVSELNKSDDNYLIFKNIENQKINFLKKSGNSYELFEIL